MSAWGTAQRRPNIRSYTKFQALKGRHSSRELCRPFRASLPVLAPTQGGAVRLCRDALPWADLGLPFQGEEFAG